MASLWKRSGGGILYKTSGSSLALCDDCPCNDCCQLWDDDFSSVLGGYTQRSMAGTPVFAVAGGRLGLSGGDGSYYRTQCFPDTYQLVVSIQAKVYNATGATRTGVFIGNIARYEALWGSSILERRTCDIDGDATGSATTFSGITSGDTLKIELVDTSAGAGTYDINYWRNNAIVHTDSGVMVSLEGVDFNAGVIGEDAGEWDDLVISCTDLANGCAACPVLPYEWDLSASGFGSASRCLDLNGDWILRFTSGCEFETPEKSAACPLGGTPSFWHMNRTTAGGTPIWLLTGIGTCTNTPQYRVLGTDWDCLGPNTFSLIVSGTTCDTRPATLTVTPRL